MTSMTLSQPRRSRSLNPGVGCSGNWIGNVLPLWPFQLTLRVKLPYRLISPVRWWP